MLSNSKQNRFRVFLFCVSLVFSFMAEARVQVLSSDSCNCNLVRSVLRNSQKDNTFRSNDTSFELEIYSREGVRKYNSYDDSTQIYPTYTSCQADCRMYLGQTNCTGK